MKLGNYHSWALTEWSVTSGTGLTMMPECRCRTKQYKLTENNDAGLSFSSAFRHPCIHACALSRSMLPNKIHTACPCPCCMFMSMLHSMSMLHANVNVHWHMYIEMPECRTVRHPVSPVPDWKKLTMPKPVRYRTKLTESSIFLVRYRTKIRDAGMPMPALVSSMPMPSYGNYAFHTHACRI